MQLLSIESPVAIKSFHAKIAVAQSDINRVSLGVTGFGESAKECLIVNNDKANESLKMAAMSIHEGDNFCVEFKSGKMSTPKETLGLYVPPMSNSRTRGAEDEMIEIVSGQEYVVLKDGPLVLTLEVGESPLIIESITVKNPNDLNLDGDVNAADIVKAVSDGKTKAEIDEIVNAIMEK